MTETIKLYRHPLSGHAHRAELMLSLLKLPYELIDVDLLSGEQAQAEFLKMNIFGQVPVIKDGETVVADSNAILVYLAGKYGEKHWYPEDLTTRAEIQRWFSTAAGLLAFGPARARLGLVFGAEVDQEQCQALSKRLLTAMESHLDEQDYLAGEGITVADVAMYTYLAHAPEGNIDLQPYFQVRAWLKRIEALPGFVPMQATKVALAG